ncbi:unnamed protein product, partial [Medioppia subpectinata]
KKYPNLKYIDSNQYDIQWKTHLLPIIKSQSVFVAYEALINEIIYLYPTLPLHKSNENLMLAIGGILVRKQFNPWIKYRFKHMFIIMKETGLLLWRTRIKAWSNRCLQIIN